MKRFTLAFALAACHHAPPVKDVPEPVGDTEVVRGGDQVFLDGKVMLTRGPDELTPRLQLRVYDHAWLHANNGDDLADWDEPFEGHEVLPVAEVLGTMLRVRFDGAEARLLVWVDRASLDTVIVHETGVASGPGAAFAARGKVGVVLMPGTWLGAVTPARDDARRSITVDNEDDGIALTGEVATSAVGDLWVPITVPTPATIRWLDPDVAIRAEAAADAPVLATTTQLVAIVSEGPADGDWQLVTTVSQHVIARGYVPAAAVGDDAPGFGTGGSWLSGHPSGPRIDVPAGTCLYDALGGDLVGIATVTTNQYLDPIDGGFSVSYETTWGTVPVVVRDLSEDPAAPSLEACADPATLTAP